METKVDNNYVDDSNVKLLNPERGFYYNQLPESDDYDDHGLLLEETWVSGTPAHTIFPAYLYLTDVCNDDLTWAGYNHPDTCQVLNVYAKDHLEKCRAAGVKVLFRPRYDTHDDKPAPKCGVYHANKIERQENHIRAVAAMLADYKDVVAFIQAGYLGKWGEWNTDPGLESTAPFLHSYMTRERIIDYVLAQYELKQIKQDVELRTPVFAKEVLERNPAANVGLHIDCYLRNDSHGGTYSHFPGSPQNFDGTEAEVYAQAEAYAKSLTANADFGGETCPHIVDEVEIKDELWRNCTTMVNETAAFHMSYLNGDYAEGAINWWYDHGCLDNLLEKLGYRFVVKRVEYPKETVAAGQPFQVRVRVKNTGWARLHKPRVAYLVLRNGATSYPYEFKGPAPEKWAPGQTATIVADIGAPSDEDPPPPGTYSVRLWIPDPDLLPLLEEAPEGYPKAKINYAVKLATLRDGEPVFDPDTAENDLGVEITVQ